MKAAKKRTFSPANLPFFHEFQAGFRRPSRLPPEQKEKLAQDTERSRHVNFHSRLRFLRMARIEGA